jgi:NAD(P)-dependent dehydrogenase (short-subunit alcohol dehydrogenase family)
LPIPGRVAIVTGATSGLGSEIAVFLAAAGARVVVAGRDAGRGQAVVERIEDAGGSAAFARHDLDEPDSAKALVAAAAETYGAPAEILVSNAAQFFSGPFDEIDRPEFDQAIGINLRGPFELVQAAVGGMVARRHGRVIFISSPAADFAVPEICLYSMTKSAINGLMRALVPEYGPFGMTFNAVQPGLTETGMTADMLSDPVVRARYAASHPNNRIGTMADVAHATQMLADDLAGHISGMSLLVDGGQTRTVGGLLDVADQQAAAGAS